MKTNENRTMEDLKKVCSKRLKALLPSLSGQDKVDATHELKISRPTLDKYLHRDIPKVETAIKLIQFFENRIKERKQELQVA